MELFDDYLLDLEKKVIWSNVLLFSYDWMSHFSLRTMRLRLKLLYSRKKKKPERIGKNISASTNPFWRLVIL